MKSFFKVLIVFAATLIVSADTNSCSISQCIQEKKQEVVSNTVSQAKDLLEVNAWTLTSKFNF